MCAGLQGKFATCLVPALAHPPLEIAHARAFLSRRPLIVVLNRVDTASSTAVAQWKKYLVNEGGLRADNRGGNVPVFFVDSKRGRGVHEVRDSCSYSDRRAPGIILHHNYGVRERVSFVAGSF